LTIEAISHAIVMTLIVGVCYNFMWITYVVWLQVFAKNHGSFKEPHKFQIPFFLGEVVGWHFR
jgi:hypothetical protein